MYQTSYVRDSLFIPWEVTLKEIISLESFCYFRRKKVKIISLSSHRAASTDLPDLFSPLVSIVHRSREVF